MSSSLGNDKSHMILSVDLRREESQVLLYGILDHLCFRKRDNENSSELIRKPIFKTR